MKLRERLKKPVPVFFKKVQKAGLVLTAAGVAILASPVALPVVVSTVAGYMVAVGSVIAAVAQSTTIQEPDAVQRMQEGRKHGKPRG
jgi:ABC-type molybdate transport system permease subunit